MQIGRKSPVPAAAAEATFGRLVGRELRTDFAVYTLSLRGSPAYGFNAFGLRKSEIDWLERQNAGPSLPCTGVSQFLRRSPRIVEHPGRR